MCVCVVSVCAWVCFSDCLFCLHISLGKGAKTFYAFFIHIIRFERKCTIIIIIIITIAATKAAQTAITITAKCTAVASGSENWVWAVTTMAQQWPREQGPKTPTIVSSIYSARSQRTEELPATVLRRQQQHWFYISAALPANFRCRHFPYHYMHTHCTWHHSIFVLPPHMLTYSQISSHTLTHTGKGRTTNPCWCACGSFRAVIAGNRTNVRQMHFNGSQGCETKDVLAAKQTGNLCRPPTWKQIFP